MDVPSAGPWPLDRAYDHCIAVTRAHYENFPVGSRLIPAAIRPHVCAIYAFARAADDFADEPGLEPDERLEKLDGWRARLDACQVSPEGPVFTALANTIRRHEIPAVLLEDLLTAFRQDVTVQRRETYEDLIAYCRFSANPIGRLVLHLFGYRDADRQVRSDAVCSALQLTNFWQDIAVDFPRGRIYLPQAEMQSYGVTEDDLASGRVTQAFRDLVAHQVGRTRRLFDAGCRLPEMVTGRLRFELRLTIQGGREILRQLEARDYDVFRSRPALTRLSAARLLVRAMARPCVPSEVKA